ncbi:MAG: DUF423 domain-containing protein [Arenimonas sp.]
MRWLSIAAMICGVAVALGAYASHAASGPLQQRLALAALFAFAHGLALIALAGRQSALANASKMIFLAGIGLFSGSLACAALFSTTTIAAPFGGSLLIFGWLLSAVDFWRNP